MNMAPSNFGLFSFLLFVEVVEYLILLDSAFKLGIEQD